MRSFLLISAFVFSGSLNPNEFIIKKKSKEDLASLSKDAIKARMGEAVRESMHALLDSAYNVVQAQRLSIGSLEESCALHEKIIGLERKLSRVAESLLDGHFVYKKNHKKRIEASLSLLQDCAADCKDVSMQLSVKPLDPKKKFHLLIAKLGEIAEKLSSDHCLRVI